MRLVDADHQLARVNFRHRVCVDLVHFESGIAAWRARCTCGWKSSLKTTDVDAAGATATAHSGGWVWSVGHDLLEPA